MAKNTALKVVEKQQVTDPTEAQVQIDLGNLSYQDAMHMTILDQTFSRVSILDQRMKIGEPSAALLDELMELSKPSSMEALFKTVCEHMAKVVKAIPRSWFTEDAPPDLPLDDPNTYKWLRADRGPQLRLMIARAKQDAKN